MPLCDITRNNYCSGKTAKKKNWTNKKQKAKKHPAKSRTKITRKVCNWNNTRQRDSVMYTDLRINTYNKLTNIFNRYNI
jgi:hypothetical protein